jgi:cyclopropane-fatty-acyl-phospholipid synthase
MNSSLKSYLTKAIRKGSLEIVDAEGKTHVFGDGRLETVRVRFTSAEAEAAAIRDPDLRLGELFAAGQMIVEQGSIYDFLMIIFRNARNALPPLPMIAISGWRLLTRRFRQINTPRRAKKNIHSHYDLDGRLYSLFLDSDLQYSCAYWEDGVTSLDEAQFAKKRHLAAKLNLQPGMRVLDIGSGWGGLGLYLAEHCGVDVVGVTLSEEQHAVSNRRAEERGLAGKARFLLQDYRKVQGPFDRIVSVGMFEHVGVTYFHAFFKACGNLLADNGSMVLHSIGRTDGPGDTSAWIQRYIFPGGYIPAVSEVIPAVEKTRLHVTDMEILRLHYAKTLRAWRERFLARREEARALYDERFCRIWEFYLAASEVAFETGLMMNFQIQITKNQMALPLTRNYMFENEEALRTKDGDSAIPLKLAGE